MSKPKTLGEKRVDYSDSAPEHIRTVKKSFADQIDFLMGCAPNPEFNTEEFIEWNRRREKAIDQIELSCMFSVKSVTFGS